VTSLQSNFAPVDEIGGPIEIIEIEGEIPEDFPEGVYIRNGDHLVPFRINVVFPPFHNSCRDYSSNLN
jgi:carotenoid cleavage dioxygenase-like enzyme